MQYMLASAVSRTLQAPGSGSLQSVNQITVPVGYAVNDLIQGSACSQASGNKVFVITALAGTLATVADLAGGAPALVFAGNPTLTVSHIGVMSAALLVDNTVFTTTNPDFTLLFRVENLSAQTGLRVLWQDTGDGFVTDIKPGPGFSLWGAINQPHAQYASFEARRYDFQGLRLGNPLNYLRLLIFVEGQYGVAAPTGAVIQYSAFVE